MASRAEADLDEIRARSDIVEVVSQYVALKRTGKNFKGLCPFHAEKTPSFTVNPSLQRWRCFGCGQYGDVFDFIMRIENVTFVEAAKMLAERLGLEFRTAGAASAQQQKDYREQILQANQLAAQFFREMLQRYPLPQRVLQQRRVAPETQERFGIGYAPPEWSALTNLIRAKQIPLTIAAEAGLVVRAESGEYYDRFRDRLMFPIWDRQGRVVAFGGRALGDAQPKYLNSPETPLFRKSRTIYALHLAKQRIMAERTALLLEGYMDVVAAHQAGFTHAIATMGTALTEEQIGVLSRLASRVIVVYDSDSAGVEAAKRAAEILQHQEIEVLIARLPDGEDPDSLLRRLGATALQECLDKAQSLPAFLLDDLQRRYDINTAEGRIKVLKGAIPILAAIPSGIERDRYITQLAPLHPAYFTNPSIPEQQIRREVERFLRYKEVGKKSEQSVPDTAPPMEVSEQLPHGVVRAESALLRGILSEEWRPLVLHIAQAGDMASEAAKQFFELVRRAWNAGMELHLPSLLSALSDPRLREVVSTRLSLEEPLNEQVLRDSAAFLQRRHKRTRQVQISAQLAQDFSPDSVNYQEYQRLIEELHSDVRRNRKE
ncbi:MAG: DNA primase [Armatimonadota bacterium]|nr:DNA primase [bacterium]MDW8320028.1 DNA primase [Armatimonadota bacterium]